MTAKSLNGAKLGVRLMLQTDLILLGVILYGFAIINTLDLRGTIKTTQHLRLGMKNLKKPTKRRNLVAKHARKVNKSQVFKDRKRERNKLLCRKGVDSAD